MLLRQLNSRRAEELPPFDKGGQGVGQGGFLRGRHKNQIPLDPPFSKGEVGVVRWPVVNGVGCLCVMFCLIYL